MSLRKIILIGIISLIILADYYLALFLANCLDIRNVIFESITGMTPNLKGQTMIFILLLFIEGIISMYVYDKPRKKD